MNIYYLKKLRQKAYDMVMIQYYHGAGSYSLVWRDGNDLVKPLRYYIDLEKAKKDLQEVRRDIILTLLESETNRRCQCNIFDNKYLSKL
jgi:hypothetical protein